MKLSSTGLASIVAVSMIVLATTETTMAFVPSLTGQSAALVSSSSSSSSLSSRGFKNLLFLYSTMADAGVPPTKTSEGDVQASSTNEIDAEEVTVPTNLPSDVGFDYVPLATCLATGQWAEADQITRDALIVISGAKAKKRDFVYFTDVKNIPSTDLATIERLWNKFSGGKFGYAVQKKKWQVSKGNFEVFCRKIGWTTTDGEVERKKRWFGASEFIYNVKKAPEGHLPLTSALRGTSLLKNILNHPVYDNDNWMKEP